MTSITAAPSPVLSRLADTDLVHFDYTGTQHYRWVEDRSTETRQWQATRPMHLTTSVRGTALFTPEMVTEKGTELHPRKWTAPAAEFLPLQAASFDDAVLAASNVSLGSFGNAQPVAIVQGIEGAYYAAPLGIWRPNGVPQYIDAAPISGKWHMPSVISGKFDYDLTAPVEGQSWKRVKGNGTEGIWSTGQLTGVRAADPAVLAVVDGTGWRDLRAPSA
ncbi:MAG: hypothetical protein JWM90_505 [Thermoleophilia bacterium]|nr:hypothetical protein [Thermoleophilia bacterium]